MNSTEESKTRTTFQSISLHVEDVERSVAFYEKLPGAQTVIHHAGHFAKIKFGEGYIQVVSIPAEDRSFHIEMNAADLNALHAALKAAGIEPDSPPAKQFFGRTQFQVHDPDGNILEFDTPD